MRVLPASLALLLGSTSAFTPSAPSRVAFNAKQRQLCVSQHSPLFNVQTPAFPNVATKDPSLNMLRLEGVMEARRCLEEIEASAAKARDYLAYLSQVAQFVRSYLEDQATPLTLTDLPELKNVQEAQEYLINIEKATASALEYLEYLEDMAKGIRLYLLKFEEQCQAGNVPDQKQVLQAHEAKTYLDDLEETARAAKDYLAYLQAVTDVVQQYLVDPNLKGIQDFVTSSLPDEFRTIAKRSMSPIGTVAKTTTPIEILKPQQRVKPPPAPALEIDTTSGPRPVKRIPPPKSVAPADYLESLRSTKTTFVKTVSGRNLDYLDSLVSQPKTAGVVPTKPVENFIDTITPSMQTKMTATKKEPSGWDQDGNVLDQKMDQARRVADRKAEADRKAKAEKRVQEVLEVQQYLDDLEASVWTAKEHLAYLKTVDGIVRAKITTPTMETPTHQFNKVFAGSTPYSESVPPEKGRSDVSHLDQMDDAGGYYLDSDESRASPTVETPTHHFSKNFADSTPYSEAGPPEKGRSDVSHMDRMDDTGGSYLDAVKSSSAFAGTGSFGKGYLESMGSTTSEPIDWSSAKSQPAESFDAVKKAGTGFDEPSTTEKTVPMGSYLDRMSPGSSQSVKRAPPAKKISPSAGSYLDTMPTASEPIDWSSAAGASPPIKATRSAASYLEQIMTTSQRGTPVDLSRAPKKVAPGSGMPTYLDQLSSPSTPVDWSTAAGRTPGTRSYLQRTRPASSASGAPRPFFLEEGVEKFFFSKLRPNVPVLGAQYMDQLEQASRNNPRMLSDEEEAIPPQLPIIGTEPLELGDEMEKRRVLDDDEKDTQSQVVAVEKEVEGWFGLAELINGRVAMVFLVFGLLVELFTGMTFPIQVGSIMQGLQVQERYEQRVQITGSTQRSKQSGLDAAGQSAVRNSVPDVIPEVVEKVAETAQSSVEMPQSFEAGQSAVQNSVPDVMPEVVEKDPEVAPNSVEMPQFFEDDWSF